MLVSVNIEKTKPGAKIPSYSTPWSCGADLYACLDEPVKVLTPGATELIPLGFRTSFDKGHGAFIYARSGIAHKCGLSPSNCVGVIDCDYRGEWMVSLHNSSSQIQVVTQGMKIAQVVFKEIEMPEFTETEINDTTVRNTQWFGSTGIY